jgi:hypothetical protein
MPIGSRTETRLESHRREFEEARRLGPMVRIEDLDQGEIDLINAEFLERCNGRAEDINEIYEAYIQTLNNWGIICPHPQGHRRYDGYHRTDVPLRFDECRWYECALCRALVINR